MKRVYDSLRSFKPYYEELESAEDNEKAARRYLRSLSSSDNTRDSSNGRGTSLGKRAVSASHELLEG